MNRAKRYSGPFALTAAALTFFLGLYLGVVTLAPKPIVRTVVQSPAHVTASMGMVDQGSYDYIRQARDKVEAAFLEACRDMYRRDPVHLRALPPACNYFATSLLALTLSRHAVVTFVPQPSSNREAQTPPATPQPYRLHPDGTPMKDPTVGFPDGSRPILCTGSPAWDMRADAPPRCRKAAEAYYSSLLKSGQFPTSGSSEGRPR